MKVLIVEDEVIAATYLKEVISSIGCEVAGMVGSGEEAIAFVRALKPDLVLMDIMLKGSMSGVDAAVEIRRRYKNVMIVFLTAYTEESMIEMAIEAKPQGYLLKPYNKEEILANIKLLMAMRKQKETKATRFDRIELNGGYSYHKEYKRLFCKGEEVLLSKKEQRCIDVLCSESHRTFDFDTLILEIWGEGANQQTLRSLVHRIRKKTAKDLIVSVSKWGYKIGLRECIR